MMDSGSKVQFSDREALLYHEYGRPGKIEIVASKPMATQRDLSLAYSPGVAVPVLAIAEDPAKAYDYTIKGNLVAVISNGTAILGLGNLGALASKPVMEGKAVLFKRFADVDSIDLEVDTEDPQRSSKRSSCSRRPSAVSTSRISLRPMLHHRAGAEGTHEHPGVP
jgi:malate dehydrogenase (oxaloacetate-decarboxylating)(NADP+)